MTPDPQVPQAPKKRKYLRYPVPIGLAVLAGFFIKISLFSTVEPVRASATLPGIPARISSVDTLKKVVRRVQKNETLSQIVDLQGIKKDQRSDILATLQGVYPHGLFEGQEFVLRTAPDSTLVDFVLYSRDRMTEYRVTGAAGSFKADKQPVPLILKTRTLVGVLSTSLYSAITEAGETPELIENVIDIFSWDINWFLEPRPGDTFKIVVEKMYRDSEFIKYGNLLAAIYINGEHRHCAYYVADAGGRPGYFDENGVSLRKSFLKAPLAYRRISSKFSLSRMHPVLNVARPHLGIDYAAAPGTPVKAAGNGVVASAGRSGGYGNCVQITHPNGYRTCYGHLNGFARGLRRGLRVTQGDVIGYVGSTGLSTGPHLDYRVARRGRFVNPLSLKAVPLRRLDRAELPAFAALKDSLQRLLDTAPAASTQYADAK